MEFSSVEWTFNWFLGDIELILDIHHLEILLFNVGFLKWIIQNIFMDIRLKSRDYFRFSFLPLAFDIEPTCNSFTTCPITIGNLMIRNIANLKYGQSILFDFDLFLLLIGLTIE